MRDECVGTLRTFFLAMLSEKIFWERDACAKGKKS